MKSIACAYLAVLLGAAVAAAQDVTTTRLPRIKKCLTVLDTRENINGGLAGRVFDEDGKPLAAVRLRLRREDRVVAEKETGVDGKFLFEGLGDGYYFLQIVDQPHDTNKNFRRKALDSMLVVRIKGGKQRDCGDIGMFRTGLEVEGRVTDQKGGPVAQARVFMCRGDGYHWGPAITDGKGVFALPAPTWNRSWGPTALKILVDGGKLFVEEHSDWTPWRKTKVEVKCDLATVRIRGKATAQGSPAKGAKVYLYRADQKNPLTYYPVAEVGEPGTFGFVDIPRGRYKLFCSFPTAPVLSVDMNITEESPGETTVSFSSDTPPIGSVVGRLEVTLAGRKFSGKNRVLKEEGLRRVLFLQDHAGAVLRPYVPGAFFKDDGDAWKFEMRNLAPGTYGGKFQTVDRNDPGKGFEKLTETSEPGWFYLVHEPWRPVPGDVLGDAISREFLFHVQAGRMTRFAVKKDYTLQDLEKILGPRAHLYEPE